MSTYETFWRIAQHIGAGGRIYLGRIYTTEQPALQVTVRRLKLLRNPAFYWFVPTIPR